MTPDLTARLRRQLELPPPEDNPRHPTIARHQRYGAACEVRRRAALDAALVSCVNALDKYKDDKAWISVPTNYGQDSRHSEFFVAAEALTRLDRVLADMENQS